MTFDELDPPPLEKDSYEIVRFFIHDDGDHSVTLNQRFPDDGAAAMWGSVLADIAVHATRMLMQGTSLLDDEATIRCQLMSAMRERLDERLNHTGQMRDVN